MFFALPAPSFFTACGRPRRSTNRTERFGDPVEPHDGDVPVFWACGVTPQAALMASAPPFAITHAPGHMLVTDVPDEVYRLP